MKKLYSFTILFLVLIFTNCEKEPGETISDETQISDEITPENALQHYINNQDDTYTWEIENTLEVENGTVYQVKLTSQTWRDLVWEHSLSISVPTEIENEGALLFISTGNNRNDNLHPGEDDRALQAIHQIAMQNKAVTALIEQVPNQPLFGDMYEDEIISHTFHSFQQDGDYSWPLLFPMVKSVVKAMDTIQELVEDNSGHQINDFMLTGYSKRGWTTWLTAAIDERIKAIAPSVIDVVNMPLNVDYQIKTWGDYSVEIQDYVRLGIAQQIANSEGQDLVTMIDPFSYRDNLTMPKLILIGANDPYWPVDAVKNYIDEFEGQNYIFYTPNAGHDLNNGREASPVTSEFFNHMLSGNTFPSFEYETEVMEDGFSISIQSNEPFLSIEQWSASSDDRDFRDEEWTSTALSGEGDESSVTISRPDEGFYATYFNIIFEGDIIPEFPLSTRMYVAGKDSVFLNPMQ